jgi:hypothetical protein
MSMLRLWAIREAMRFMHEGPACPKTLPEIDGKCNDDLRPPDTPAGLLPCVAQPIDNRPNLAKHAPRFLAIARERLGMREMSRRRHGDVRYLRLAIISMIRVAVSIAIVDYAGAASAGDRHADLLAYDIFTGSAPRPPRSVPNVSVKGDRAGTAARTRLPREGDSPVRVQQAPHPSDQMFPPVTPLE